MKMLDIARGRLDALETQRAAAFAELDQIPTVAETEKRELTPEEATRAADLVTECKQLDNDINALRSQVADLEQIEARATADNARRAPIPGMVSGGDPFDIRGGVTPAEARSRALTAVEKSNKFLKHDHAEAVTQLIQKRGQVGEAAARLTLTTGSDTYERAWSKYMSGNEFGMTQEERQALARGRDVEAINGTFGDETRAMTSGTGASGGFFVPVYIDPTMIITGAGAVNPLRQLATVKQIGPAFGGWFGATAAQVTAAWTAEGSAAPDNTPTVTQPNIPVYMAEAFVGVSYQAFEDISDLAGDVLNLFMDAKINLEGAAFQTGTGVSQPTGVMTAISAVGGSRVTTAAVATFAFADTLTVHRNLPARFRNTVQDPKSPNRAWLANIAVIDQIRSLLLAQNSANSAWTDMAAGAPASLLGDPIYEGSALSASFSTTGQDILLYGAFDRYYIVDRIGFTTEFIPNLFDTATGRPTASRGWISHWRTGANAVDTNAFRDLRVQ